MNPWLRLLCIPVLFSVGSVARAETPEDHARNTSVSLTLNDVSVDAAAHFVEVLSKVRVHYTGQPGERPALSLSVANSSADETLRYLARLANLELTYKADAVYLSPRK
jgi:hypothetical protein